MSLWLLAGTFVLGVVCGESKGGSLEIGRLSVVVFVESVHAKILYRDPNLLPGTRSFIQINDSMIESSIDDELM